MKKYIAIVIVLSILINVCLFPNKAIASLMTPLYWQDTGMPYAASFQYSGHGSTLLTEGRRLSTNVTLSSFQPAGTILNLNLAHQINVHQVGPFLPNEVSHIQGNMRRGTNNSPFQIAFTLPTGTGSLTNIAVPFAIPVEMLASTSYTFEFEVMNIHHGNPSSRVFYMTSGLVSSSFTNFTTSQPLNHISIRGSGLSVSPDLNTRTIRELHIGRNDNINISYLGLSSLQISQLGGSPLTGLPPITLSPHVQTITIPQSSFVWTNNSVVVQMTASTGSVLHIRIIRPSSNITASFNTDLAGRTHPATLTVSGIHSNRVLEPLQLRLTHPASQSSRLMNVTSVTSTTWQHTFTHLSHGIYTLEIGHEQSGLFMPLQEIVYSVEEPIGTVLQSGIIRNPSPEAIIYADRIPVEGSVANIPSTHSVRVILRQLGGNTVDSVILPIGQTSFNVEFLNVVEGRYTIDLESFEGLNFRLLTSHRITVASSTLAPPTVDPNAGVLEQIRQSVEVVLWWLMSPFRTIGDIGRVIISTIAESYQDGVGTFVAMMGIFYSVMPEPMANAIMILVNVTVLVTVIKLVRG